MKVIVTQHYLQCCVRIGTVIRSRSLIINVIVFKDISSNVIPFLNTDSSSGIFASVPHCKSNLLLILLLLVLLLFCESLRLSYYIFLCIRHYHIYINIACILKIQAVQWTSENFFNRNYNQPLLMFICHYHAVCQYCGDIQNLLENNYIEPLWSSTPTELHVSCPNCSETINWQWKYPGLSFKNCQIRLSDVTAIRGSYFIINM